VQFSKPETLRRYLSHCFAFAFIWSIGATVLEKYAPAIDNLTRDIFQSIIFPNQETVYAYYLDAQGELIFRHWGDRVPQFEYEHGTPFFQLLVPTIDTCRYSFIAEQLLGSKKHIYVTGASGTGKSVLVASLLNELKEPKQLDSF
jgi:dynein heavy chain